MNVDNLISFYKDRDLYNLSSNLGNKDERIKFEKWLFTQQTSPKTSAILDFSWHNKVISLLCKQICVDTSPTKSDEDELIASIIFEMKPLVNRINSSANKILNTHDQIGINESLILSEIKHADLPITCIALLIKQLEHQPLDVIVLQSIKNNNISMLQIIQKKYPQDFANIIRDLMGGKMNDFNNPLYFAVYHANHELIELMAKITPDKFRTAMLDTHPADGKNILHVAVDNGNAKIIEAISTAAPEEFKVCMKIKNKSDETPLKIAIRYNNQQIIELMAKNAPEEFKAEMPEVYGLLKSRNMTKRLQTVFNINVDSEYKEINRIKVNRRAIGHAFHVGGKTEIATTTGTHKVTVELEGHHARQWFQFMHKNFENFKAHYNNILSESEFKVMQESLNFSANLNNIPTEAQLEKIKTGFPVMLNAGYPGHEVTLLLWGNKLIICNRGEGSNSPIEIFNFDPNKLDLEDLKKIESTKYRGNEGMYKKLFFETFKNKLNFYQTESDVKLQKNCPLPPQTIGNCSFVSSVTSVYALILMLKSFGIDKEGNLIQTQQNEDGINTETDHADLSKIKEAISLYQTGVSVEQITILERNIIRNEKNQLDIKQDHNLIFNALAKAHLLPLDQYCQERLQTLTDTYLNGMTDEIFRNRIKTALAFLKTKPRVPLL